MDGSCFLLRTAELIQVCCELSQSGEGPSRAFSVIMNLRMDLFEALEDIARRDRALP